MKQLSVVEYRDDGILRVRFIFILFCIKRKKNPHVKKVGCGYILWDDQLIVIYYNPIKMSKYYLLICFAIDSVWEWAIENWELFVFEEEMKKAKTKNVETSMHWSKNQIESKITAILR